MSKRFLKYETEVNNPNVDEDGVLKNTTKKLLFSAKFHSWPSGSQTAPELPDGEYYLQMSGESNYKITIDIGVDVFNHILSEIDLCRYDSMLVEVITEYYGTTRFSIIGPQINLKNDRLMCSVYDPYTKSHASLIMNHPDTSEYEITVEVPTEYKLTELYIYKIN